MCYNIKSFYFSAYFGYNMLSERVVQTQKSLLGCTLRYLKYICSLTLICVIQSFSNIFFLLVVQLTILKL